MKPDVWVFRAAAALRVEPTLTRSTDRRDGIATVTWHAAKALVGGDGRYDTDNALMVQVSPREMTDVIAALCGWIPTLEFRYHGSDRNKSYRLDQADDGIVRLTLSAKQTGRFVFDLSASERMTCLTLCFRQYQRSQGGIGSDTLFAMLQAVYTSHCSEGEAQQ